jgi:hypothetical protein
VPQGQKLMRRGFRWRDVRTVAIGLKPVVLRVKVNRARSTIRHPSFARDFRVGFDKGGTARITWIKLKSIKKFGT